MKIAIGVIVGIIIVIIGFFAWSPDAPATVTEGNQVTGEKAVVTEGKYTVRPTESSVSWAGKKPLIEGYVNSGSIGVADGSITVGSSTATGVFSIDMNTLSVSATPTKPGKESTLAGHLKGEGWFNVATYPKASFAITEVKKRSDSDTTFLYDVRGNLTLKGKTGELTFPASIYLDDTGLLHASAEFEFDRTKWGITSGSKSFFDNLADNAIDDMVALSFHLVAEKQ
jgi:polyisoprenoid-binding protein YceI